MAHAPSAPPPRIWRTGLTPRSALLLVAAVVAALVVRDAFVAAHRTVGWVVACAIVALLLDPLVDRAGRVLPRWLSVIVVLVGVLSLVAAITAGLASDAIQSIDDLERALPEAAAGLEERYDWAVDVGVVQRVDDFVSTLDERLGEDVVSEALGTAPTYFVTGILMLFLLAYGPRYFESFVAQFAPERRTALRTVSVDAAVRGRTYLLYALANALVNGVLVGGFAWMLDLPAASSLGVAVGVFTVLPLIGVLVGGLPAMLLAFGLEGWPAGVAMLALLIALQLFEALIVRRTVDPRTVRAGPTIPIVVGLLGFELYGLGGAIYGLALAVIALAALDSVGHLRGEVDPERSPTPAE